MLRRILVKKMVEMRERFEEQEEVKRDRKSVV